jgi:hypothetical protein
LGVRNCGGIRDSCGVSCKQQREDGFRKHVGR